MRDDSVSTALAAPSGVPSEKETMDDLRKPATKGDPKRIEDRMDRRFDDLATLVRSNLPRPPIALMPLSRGSRSWRPCLKLTRSSSNGSSLSVVHRPEQEGRGGRSRRACRGCQKAELSMPNDIGVKARSESQGTADRPPKPMPEPIPDTPPNIRDILMNVSPLERGARRRKASRKLRALPTGYSFSVHTSVSRRSQVSLNKRITTTFLLSALALFVPQFAISQILPASSSLPSPELQEALSALPTAAPRTTDASSPLINLPKSRPNDGGVATGRSQIHAIRPAFPFASAGALIVQFEPTTTASDISQFVNRRSLAILETYPLIGAIKVAFDFNEYLAGAGTTTIKALLQVVDDFEAEPVVRVATPDLLLRNQQESVNLLNPSHVQISDVPGYEEITGWGVRDTEADQLWDFPRATDGVVFAALDVGFYRHEDLVFSSLAPNTNVNDHGNHVAGIACAQHNDLGIKGVLPRCFIHARATDFFLLDRSIRQPPGPG